MLRWWGQDSPTPFPALLEKHQLRRWRGSCRSPSHTSAQLINRLYQTNKLFLLLIDSNLLAPGEPRLIYPTCHPCLAAALTSALLSSPLLLLHSRGRAGHSCGHTLPHAASIIPRDATAALSAASPGDGRCPITGSTERKSGCPSSWHPHPPWGSASPRNALAPASPFL